MDQLPTDDEAAFLPGTMASSVLGEPKAEFRPGLSNLFAGVVLALLSAGATLFGLFFLGREVVRSGGNLPFFHEKAMSWVILGLLLLLCVAGVIVTCFFVMMVKSIWSLRFQFCADGFLRENGEKVEVFPWSEVVLITETQLHERVPIVKGPANLLIPRYTSRSYEVLMANETTCRFDGDSVRELKKLGELLRAEANARGIGWEIKEESA